MPTPHHQLAVGVGSVRDNSGHRVKAPSQTSKTNSERLVNPPISRVPKSRPELHVQASNDVRIPTTDRHTISKLWPSGGERGGTGGSAGRSEGTNDPHRRTYWQQHHFCVGLGGLKSTENITFGGFSAARASAGDAMCYAVPCAMLCHVLA
jgi:hypothetical protein